MKIFFSLAGAAAVLAVASTVSVAGAPEECAAFVVFSDGSARRVAYADHLPKGKSIGDQRIGFRNVQDEGGNQVGEARWIATVIDVATGDSKDVTAAEGLFQFPAGVILYKRPPAPVYNTPDNPSQVAGRGDYIVIGGSGAFRGATGTVKRASKDIMQSYEFDITCG